MSTLPDDSDRGDFNFTEARSRDDPTPDDPRLQGDRRRTARLRRPHTPSSTGDEDDRTSSATSTARTRSTRPVPWSTRPASATRSRCRRSRTIALPARPRSTEHPAPRDRAPVVRRRGLARDLDRHLVQRGLGGWSEWYWETRENGGTTPEQQFDDGVRRRSGRRLVDSPGDPRRRPATCSRAPSRSTRAAP